MAGFLRKKKHDPPPIRSPSPPLNHGNASPIFARFATTTVDPPAQRVVSSPMALGSASRNVQPPRGLNAGAGRTAIQQWEDIKQMRQPAGASYVPKTAPSSSSSSSASNSLSSGPSYGSPVQNRISSPPTRIQTLPPPAAVNIPTTTQNRRFSQAAAADKPLPAIHPAQDNYSDPLGSPPPQSALPANRRASRGGAPPQVQNLPNGRVMHDPTQQQRMTRSPSNPTVKPGTRAIVPPLNNIGDSSRYPNEFARQDLRAKLPEPNAASGASPPRHVAPAQWASPTSARAPYQVPDDTSLNSNPRGADINSAAGPSESGPGHNMGATISSFEVQSFHPDNSFKINTGVLPHHITPGNPNKPARAPKRTPSALVKGKPLIFSAMGMDDSPPPNEKPAFDPYANGFSTPTKTSPPPHPLPVDPVEAPPHMPPQFVAEENEGVFDFGFTKTGFDGWDPQEQLQQQPPPPQPQTPKVKPNILPPPTVIDQVQTPRSIDSGHTPLPPRSPPPPPQIVPLQQQQPQPQTPQRILTKKESKSQLKAAAASLAPLTLMSPPSRSAQLPSDPPTPHTPHTPRTLTKLRPTTPQRKLSSAALQQPSPSLSARDERAASRASTLMLDDDPFAKVDPIRMLKPMSSVASFSSTSVTDLTAPSPAMSHRELDGISEPATPRQEAFNNGDNTEDVIATPPRKMQGPPSVNTPSSPVTPEEYRTARTRRRGDVLEKSPPHVVRGIEVRETRIPAPFPLVDFVTNPPLLSALLAYLSFYDWCLLSAVTKDLRMRLVGTHELREVALERYLKTVGYARWAWSDEDPLELTLLDLHDYMRGVSLPTHEYARVAETYVQSFSIPPAARDPSHLASARNLTMSTRAYTRVVLRLRAQAEREAADVAAAKAAGPPVPPKKQRISNGYASNRSSPSRTSSRAPSPTSGHGHQASTTFRSPLFRLKRAPLLRVFVPSPDGDWLSDKSVLECEAELKRANVLGLLRVGDVVWDIAVGDEGNVGRLIWDGSYLIDLDYKYSTVGDLPQYLPTLAFPPSYFHRVVRTGPSSSNPVVHIDIAPWGQEIATNLQLLQDRIRTETPQGNVHNVVRWVHRSSFIIRAPPKQRQSMSSSGSRRPPSPARIPIPDSTNLYVDSGWYGTIVVETEGTNEALADLQDRCPGAFPPRAGGPQTLTKEMKDARRVFKILREKSRPGEIWIRAVGPKEKLF
ncbi:hypothetical protein R3P38DRAFT_2685050 [Favolaschia claudopus]|uniref:F-box domain-containing protein n=1 Tax=Favolaschia claudopus TaxID=2862362 RepID=A0AAW0DIV1_9AGAR